MQSKLAFNSGSSSYLGFPSTGIIGVHSLAHPLQIVCMESSASLPRHKRPPCSDTSFLQLTYLLLFLFPGVGTAAWGDLLYPTHYKGRSGQSILHL
jgi:hypothetical protein